MGAFYGILCILARLKGLLGRLGAVLGVSWGILGTSWDLLGRLGRHLGASWGRLGGSWEGLGASWERLGSVLGASWERLGHPFEKISKKCQGDSVFRRRFGPKNETLGTSKMSVSSRRNANFRKMTSVEKNVRSRAKIKTCLSKEREAR